MIWHAKDKARFMSQAPDRTVRFRAFRDEDADVWVATSDADRITTEAVSKQEIIDRLSVIVPDVLQSRNDAPTSLTIVIDWQELRTIDQTAFAVA
ncbi:DUF1902 domain-containing protein [Beijerinckia sp. L45]|uniref:DUF1902 domain-containing protein n=1 Tax=Beijerinckia sp. L45 TaxID=1641855 RepID=UPI0034CD1919